MAGLLDMLPDELVMEVLGRLDLVSWAKVRRICPRLYALANEAGVRRCVDVSAVSVVPSVFETLAAADNAAAAIRLAVHLLYDGGCAVLIARLMAVYDRATRTSIAWTLCRQPWSSDTSLKARVAGLYTEAALGTRQRHGAIGAYRLWMSSEAGAVEAAGRASDLATNHEYVKHVAWAEASLSEDGRYDMTRVDNLRNWSLNPDVQVALASVRSSRLDDLWEIDATARRVIARTVDRSPVSALYRSCRPILIDWLFEVGQMKQMDPRRIFLASRLSDRYITKTLTGKKKLQLVGVTAMVLASRMSSDIITVREGAWLTNNTYTYNEVTDMMGRLMAVAWPVMHQTNPHDLLTIFRAEQSVDDPGTLNVILGAVEVIRPVDAIDCAGAHAIAALIERKDPWPSELEHRTGIKAGAVRRHLPRVYEALERYRQDVRLQAFRPRIDDVASARMPWPNG